MKNNNFIILFNLIRDFEQMIIEKFNLLLIDLPIVQNFDYNFDLINFDNRKSSTIFQFKEEFDNDYVILMNLLRQNNSYNGIFFKYFLINRNFEINESNSIIEYYYDLCIKTTLTQTNYEDFILNIEKKILSFFNIQYNTIGFKDFAKFNKKIKYFNNDDYLFQEIHNKKILNIININSKYTSLYNCKFYDDKLTTTLLYWYEKQSSAIPLISFYFITNNYKDLISQPFIKIRINLSKLLMIFLDKKNIEDIYDWRK